MTPAGRRIAELRKQPEVFSRKRILEATKARKELRAAKQYNEAAEALERNMQRKQRLKRASAGG
jgi:hypothetical protein